jgi:NADP-dependent 3-hydroxy acid dehydrogenase YdfG
MDRPAATAGVTLPANQIIQEGRKMTEGMQGLDVVITGAGRGLGAALAIVMADAGANVVLCGRTPDNLTRIAAAIVERTGHCPPVVDLDLADTASVAQATSRIAEAQPKIDVLVNNGAMWLARRAGGYTEAEVFGTANAAITGTYLFTQALLPCLMRSTRPDIVTIGSISGQPNTRLLGAAAPYLAAKHGQAGLIDGLRQELTGTPVRVIGIHPPNLDDVSPLDADWDAVPDRKKGERVTSRDVVDSVLFAITRPRHVTVASLLLDSDGGGMWS